MKSFETPRFETVEGADFESSCLDEEQGVLTRFSGKAGRVARILMLISVFSIGGAIAKEASAAETPADHPGKVEQVERRLTAMDIVQKIYALTPSHERTPAQNEIMAEEGVKKAIWNYAREKKGLPSGSNVFLSLEEWRELYKEIVDAAAQHQEKALFGITDADEFEKKQQELRSGSLGIRALSNLQQENERMLRTMRGFSPQR